MSAMRTLLVTLTIALAGASTAHAGLAEQVAATPVVHAGCPGYEWAAGCLQDGTIYLPDRRDRSTLYHERGHVFASLLTDSDRRYFSRLVGMPRRAWLAEVPGDESPDERFADAYETCKMRVRVKPQQMMLTNYGYVVRPGRHRRVCNAIAFLEWTR